jgi:hypothetical protein
MIENLAKNIEGGLREKFKVVLLRQSLIVKMKKLNKTLI